MGQRIVELRLQGPAIREGGYLCIVKAVDEGQNKLVSFRSGGTFKETITKVATDAANGELGFKEEKPWKPEK